MATGTEIAIPTARDLEGLSPSDRWDLEDALDTAQDALRDFNDDELRRWVEVEGKTQREIAGMVGRSQQRINQRCRRLELSSRDRRGGKRTLTTPSQNGSGDEPKVVDAEVVNDGPRLGHPPYPEILADEDHENPRVQVTQWFEHGAWLEAALGERPLEVESRKERDLVKRQAQEMERLAKRVRREVKVNGRA